MKSWNLNSIAAATGLALILLLPNETARAQDCPAPSFSSEDVLKADFDPLALVVGDFNRDGKDDIVATEPSSNRVSVLLGKGDATFYSLAKFSAGVRPWRIASGDFNDDGKLDLVTANIGSGDPTGRSITNGGISVLLGKGDATFESAISYTGPASTSIVVADFNGDNRVDLAVGSYPGAILVLAGRGDGTFQTAASYDLESNAHSTAVGDFNGDGNADLAVAKGGFYDRGSGTFTNHGLSVMLGKGDGTFHPAIKYETGAPPGSVATADLDGDGKPDLALASSGARGGSVSVLLGNGDGTFEAGASYEAASDSWPMVAGDFNGDTRPDLALGGVSVMLGKGDGTFDSAVNYPAGFHISSLSGGDFNDDGKPDLAVVDYYYSRNISVLLNQGDGTFRTPPTIYAEGANKVVAGDFNTDGRVDLAVTRDRNLSMLLGKGDGTWQALGYQPFERQLGHMLVGDFNADAKPDLATVSDSYTNLLISIHLGKGDGTFELGNQHYTAGWSHSFMVVSDFNVDGKLDLAVAGSVLLGKGDGTFPAAVNYSAPGQPIAVADFNDDGKPDLVAASYSANIWILLGKGDGAFEAAVPYGTAAGPRSVTVGDFNSDGKLDLATANLSHADWFVIANMSVLMGNGDGSLQAAINYDVSPTQGVDSLLADDFNGDGKLDLVMDGVFVRLGNGDGTFQAPITFNGGRRGFSMARGDFNTDGKPDVAVAAGDYLSVLLNTCASAGILLDAERSSTNLILSWPLAHSDFVLESTTHFSLTNWQGFSGGVKTNNARCEVVVPLDQAQRYFRLRKS